MSSNFASAFDDTDVATIDTFTDEYVVVRLHGDLDMLARQAVSDALDWALDTGADVVVDLTGVTFMYTGSHVLVVAAAARSSTPLRVFAPNRPARMMFELTGTGHLVDTGIAPAA